MYSERQKTDVGEFSDLRGVVHDEDCETCLYIPDHYVTDINQRLVLYRRIASALDDEEVIDIEEEIMDRFGKLPPQVEALLEVARVKNILREALAVSVDVFDSQIVFTFHEDAEESLDKILAIVAADPDRFRFSPDLKLYASRGEEDMDVLQEIKKILK